MKIHYKKLIGLIVVWGGLIAFLTNTDPNKLTVGWLIVPFAWLFVAIFVTVRYLLSVFGHYLGSRALKPKRHLTVAIIAAAVPTFLLLLDSINQLTPKDVLLVLVLGLGLLFYVNRLSISKSKAR